MTALRVGAAPARHRAAPLLIGLAGAFVVGDAVVEVAAGAAPISAISWLAAMAGLALAGLVVLRDPAHAGLGELLLGAAAAGSCWDLVATLPFGPFPFASGLLYWPYAGLLAHVLVRWPDARVGSVAGRVLLGGIYGLFPAMTLAWQLTWNVRWFGAVAADWWWVTLLPARDASADVYDAQRVAYAVVIVALAALLVVRAVRARGARLVAIVPVTVVAVALGLVVILSVLQEYGVAPGLETGLLSNLALLALPAGVIVATLRNPGDGDPSLPGAGAMPLREFRARYRIGVATGIALLVVAVALAVVGLHSADLGGSPTPVPGPQLQAG